MCVWTVTSSAPALDSSTVHVWRADLACVGASGDVLSAFEWERARRFHRVGDAERFVRRRVALRALLSKYLGVTPGEVPLSASANGRPLVTGADLDFNASSSGDLMVCVVAKSRIVGVDVEAVSDRLDDGAEFLSAAEQRAIHLLPQAQQPSAMAMAWARKEALAKAIGAGLRIEPVSIIVPSGKGPVVAGGLPPPFAARLWHLYDLEPGPGVAGALAVSGGLCGVRRLQWSAELL